MSFVADPASINEFERLVFMLLDKNCSVHSNDLMLSNLIQLFSKVGIH